MAGRKAKTTPPGRLVYPYVNEPDHEGHKRYPNTSLRYKTSVICKLNTVSRKIIEEIDQEIDTKFAEVEEALTEAQKKKMAKEGKSLSKQYPYEELENDDGTPTGEVKFSMAQNVTITKNGVETKVDPPAIFNAKGEIDMGISVRGGDLAKVKFAQRPYYNASALCVGVTLDLWGVLIVSQQRAAPTMEAVTEEELRECGIDPHTDEDNADF